MNCPNCGRENYDKTKTCVWCGTSLNNPFQRRKKTIKPIVMDQADYQSSRQNKQSNEKNATTPLAKQRVVAGVLAIFLGSFGVHNFYLGYSSRGLTQLILTTFGSVFLVGPLISITWSFVEGMLIFADQINQDALGKPLV